MTSRGKSPDAVVGSVQQIAVLTGEDVPYRFCQIVLRRSGKSELMKAYIRRITGTQPDANIIFVDFFDLKYENLKEYHALYDYIEDHYEPEKTNYVFVDEVQNTGRSVTV